MGLTRDHRAVVLAARGRREHATEVIASSI
jgi:hypothetical protein